MVIPIEDAMIKRDNFTPILSVVMVIYTTLCILSGGLGYMAFGDATEVMRYIFVCFSLYDFVLGHLIGRLFFLVFISSSV